MVKFDTIYNSGGKLALYSNDLRKILKEAFGADSYIPVKISVSKGKITMESMLKSESMVDSIQIDKH